MALVVITGTVVAGALLLAGPGSSPPAGGQDTAAGASVLDVLQEIDAAERAMITFQRSVIRARRGSESAGEVAAAVVEAAEQAVADLQDIRGRLTSGSGAGGRLDAVRTTYVDHLDAWVDYLREVAEDPSIAGPDAPAGAFRAINTTAREFASTLRAAISPAWSDDATDLARLILRRGFSPETSEETVTV